ncbi:ExbD/TolR family protein [Spirochaeta cellobiosiphila]|uniref:ExbD/TolR family protein n=1 Tax=Spirochaeta cellobiosiphila TaxID=504483 RepID=UPI000423C0E7|nr:biopolymer transporter ExbD [Spirochaeta cellobiosiphila]
MINIHSKRQSPTPPLSAMSDIGFLLLIFIMLISLINYRKEAKVEYPEAHNAEKTEALHEIEIWIEQNGAIQIDGQYMSDREVENFIVDTFLAQRDTRIHIIADRNTPYRNVDHINRILQNLQYRIVSYDVKEQL